MNSCTNIIFKFPRTVNQVTVSKNPLQFNMLCTVANKPYIYQCFFALFNGYYRSFETLASPSVFPKKFWVDHGSEFYND